MDAGLRGDKPPVFGAGRFEVRGTLGTGGAGVVYRAFDKQLGREVALKHLKIASGRDLFRFKREFRSLADITHPGLVALHELHAVDGDWWFTMELVEGVSWIDWVRPSQRGVSGPSRSRQDIMGAVVSDARLRGALIQLVDALIALHRAGKLHRDLKPSNVLVTSQGRLALLDFGLVAQITEGDPERLAVGTPAYMSPEQASDQSLGEPSDWYSVGCMLYEALTGRRPFEGEAEQIMTRKQREAPPHPTTFVAKAAPPIAADLARLCMALLVPVPSARPTGMQILTQLGAAPSSTTRRFVKSMPPVAFVGRHAEIDELKRALFDTRRRGVTVVLKGRSGIGKSTLVRRFVRDLGDAVFAVEGRCFEREAVPFKMLDGVIDALTGVIVGRSAEEIEALAPKELGSLVRLFPVMRRVPQFADALETSPMPADPQELRRRGFTALRGILVRLARTKPVVVFVDDAHWGDADSCTFLAELIHGADPGVLIVVAQRPEDYLGMIAQLRRPPGGTPRRGDIRDLELAPLTDDDARSLVAQVAEDPARAAIVVPAAAGNPLVLTEMARAHALPENAKMADLVRARVMRLSSEAQAMLAVSAIAARPLPVAIAAHAAGVTGGHDEAAVLSAERLATLRHVDGEAILTPAHDYVRSAVVASLGTEAKASYHEAIAVAFESVQETDRAATARLDSQAIVEHWLAAGHPANAAHHAVAAAQTAEDALTFKRAAELYQIALTFGPWDIEGQRDLMARKAHALACAGQLDEAITEYGLAAQMVPDTESIDLERLRVEALLRRGRFAEALPAAEALLGQIALRVHVTTKTSRTKLATQWMQAKLRGLEFEERAIADADPQALLAADVLYSIASGLAFTDPALGRVVQSELIRSALDAGEPIRVALALAQEIIYTSAAGSRTSSTVETVTKRLQTVAARVGAPQITGIADVAMGIGDFANGRWREARERLESGLAVMRDHGAGVRWEIDIGDTYWLASLFYLGEWREMSRHAQLLLRDALERGDVIAQQWLRSGRCNTAWILAGRADDAHAHLDAATAMLGDGFQLPHVHAIVAAAELDLFAGDAASAGHRLRDAWAQIERLGVLRMQQPRIELAMLRARIALVQGDPRSAREHAQAMIKEDVAWGEGLGRMLAAACAVSEGDSHGALDALALAEPLLDATGMLGFLCVARAYRGRLEGGAAGVALEVAARDALVELGARDPEIVAYHLVPWSG
jgi:tRNA A-37 threonylcarbamoyl transferase component Bud32/tetratricopeptide (TPR) repeat protein